MFARQATENLSLFSRFQDWLDARTSARALYRMDERALADLALSQSDVERVNARVRWPR